VDELVGDANGDVLSRNVGSRTTVDDENGADPLGFADVDVDDVIMLSVLVLLLDATAEEAADGDDVRPAAAACDVAAGLVVYGVGLADDEDADDDDDDEETALDEMVWAGVGDE
jgi:hypothetical protein